MKTSFSFSQPPMSWFDASSELFLALFMGGGYLFGMQGIPSLGSATDVVVFYRNRCGSK